MINKNGSAIYLASIMIVRLPKPWEEICISAFGFIFNEQCGKNIEEWDINTNCTWE